MTELQQKPPRVGWQATLTPQTATRLHSFEHAPFHSDCMMLNLPYYDQTKQNITTVPLKVFRMPRKSSRGGEKRESWPSVAPHVGRGQRPSRRAVSREPRIPERALHPNRADRGSARRLG